jgi:hypothetical protein
MMKVIQHLGVKDIFTLLQKNRACSLLTPKTQNEENILKVFILMTSSKHLASTIHSFVKSFLENKVISYDDDGMVEIWIL